MYDDHETTALLLLPSHHNNMTDSNNNTHNHQNNHNKNMHDNIALVDEHSGFTFRIHPMTSADVEDRSDVARRYIYSCHPFHRDVAWSYTCPVTSDDSVGSGSGWSVQSELLLEITYRPAYQALPSYTADASAVVRVAKQAAAKFCCSRYSKEIHFVREVYTWEDISEFRYLNDLDHIRGVGPCQAVEIVLRPKTRILDDGHEYEIDESPSVIFALPITSTHDPTDGIKRMCPPLLWKAKVPRDPSIAIQTITVFDGILATRDDSLFIKSSNNDPTHIYCNGWQSWSFAGSVPKGSLRPKSAMPRFLSKAFNRGGKFPPPGVMHMHKHAVQRLRRLQSRDEQIHNGFDERSISYHANGTRAQILPERQSSRYKSEFFVCLTQSKSLSSDSRADNDISSLDENGGPALVMGWLAQHRQFGVIAVDDSLKKLAMHCPCDGALLTNEVQTDWAYCQIMNANCYDDEPMASYVETVAEFCGARSVSEPLSVGWCSWYHYYENIDEKTLKDNFYRMKELRNKFATNVAIIDDGYMVSWGDWENLKPTKFSSPNSMKELAMAMKASGMRSGLWLAPFACDKNSQLARDHPDWIIRNHQGAPANSANCGKFFYGLDATNPAVLKHATDIVHKAVHEWGFEVLKLDFLYASCLTGNGKYDLSKTRAETMHLSLKSLREAAGDNAFIIGCGCPLGPAIGLVDGMRVSADTGPTWKPKLPLPWWDWSTLPCLFAMIRNSMTRMVLGYRWWHNDPGKSTNLTLQEIKSAATVIAMSGGMLLLSDDLPALSRDRIDIASKLFPVTGASAIPLDMHCASDVLPSKLRIWCSDEHSIKASGVIVSPAKKRNTIRVVKGLGSWGCISIGNWNDSIESMRIPLSAFMNSNNNFHTGGYHVFSFWNQSYVWIPQRSSGKHRSISKLLAPHESEVFHVKPVSSNCVQYIGSDFHFSCGFELDLFNINDNKIFLKLKLSLQRSGHVFLFIPIDCNIEVLVCGERFAVDIVSTIPLQGEGNRRGKVVRIPAFVKLDGSDTDGTINISLV